MGITPRDRDELKATLLKVGLNEPNVFAEILAEVKNEIQQVHYNPSTPVDAETEKLMQQIFAEYDEVFKALA